MSSRKIPKYLKEVCKDDEKMISLLNQLYMLEMENRGWWKESYKDIIKDHVKGD